MQKARGSAIVIAMLLVTAVGAVGFTFGKVLNIQISNETSYENGLGAYYSAESGLEEGFLRYRYNRDAQVPSFSPPLSGKTSSQSWVDSTDNIVRANLTLGNLVTSLTAIGENRKVITDMTSSPNYLNSQYYDLRMGSAVGTTAGNLNASPLDPDYSNYHIDRDETKKIDLGGIFNTGMNADINLSFKIDPLSTVAISPIPANHKCTLIEAKLELQPLSGPVIEKKKLLYNDSSCNYGTIISDYSTAAAYTMSAGIASITYLRSKIAPSIFYSKATLFLKPIGSAIDYSLTETGTTSVQTPLNGANSVITSTGYFGGVNRTLEAKIDRSSGSLYDLYDYVIFKN